MLLCKCGSQLRQVTAACLQALYAQVQAPLQELTSLQSGASKPAKGKAPATRLRDVHIGLSLPAGAEPAHVHTIWGSYEYFHYCQARQPP